MDQRTRSSWPTALRMRWVCVLALWLGLATHVVSATASAATPDVHRWLTEHALRDVCAPQLMVPPTKEQVYEFFLWLGGAMAGKADDKKEDPDSQRFLARFPDTRSWSRFAIRGFLGLSQEQTPAVWGLDVFEPEGAEDRFNLWVKGSAQPDLDRRNQDRFAYDGQGRQILLGDGRPVPADPLILNMGKVSGLSSQAHAHYQLAADQPSADPAVLQQAPWNFVVPVGFEGPVATSAAEMAQMHLDMAVLALAWADEKPNSGGEYLALMWASAGLHYVQDAAGPLHNVQVGSYALFRSAKLQWWLRALQTGGGLWGEPLPTFVSLGMGLLHNCHLLAEAWLERQIDRLRMGKPVDVALQQAWQQGAVDDPELIAALGDRMKPHMAGPFVVQPWQGGEGAATVLVHTLAKLGSRDGAALYDAALQVAGPRARDPADPLPEGGVLREGDLGDLQDQDVATAIGQLARLHAKSVRRALTATRLYYKALQEGSGDAAARRLRRTRLDALEAQAQRVAAYRAKPPPVAATTERVPAVAAAEVGVVALLAAGVGWSLWRRRRRAA